MVARYTCTQHPNRLATDLCVECREPLCADCKASRPSYRDEPVCSEACYRKNRAEHRNTALKSVGLNGLGCAVAVTVTLLPVALFFIGWASFPILLPALLLSITVPIMLIRFVIALLKLLEFKTGADHEKVLRGS